MKTLKIITLIERRYIMKKNNNILTSNNIETDFLVTQCNNVIRVTSLSKKKRKKKKKK